MLHCCFFDPCCCCRHQPPKGQYPSSLHHTRGGVFLYAESDEATPTRPFRKPHLGLVEWPAGSGSKANNILVDFGDDSSMGGLGAGITLDTTSPGANSTNRFKFFGEAMGGARYLLLGESSDGLRFTGQRNLSIANGRWDTHKNVVYDPATNRWVGYIRCNDPSDHTRVQCWTESLTADYATTSWTTARPTGLNSSGDFQPDALVAFRYEGIWLGFANVFNPINYYPGHGDPGPAPSAAPAGQVYGVLAWSPDARHWEYIAPDQSFIPHGANGSFDCCGIFMAKQNPAMSPAYAAGENTLPLFYAGANGAFFGARATNLGSVAIGRHQFAGLSGPANVTSVFTVVERNGTLKVTATGGVTVTMIGVGGLEADFCDPIDGVEVAVTWRPNPLKPRNKLTNPFLKNHIGGGKQIMFTIPTGGVLYAWHMA